MSQRSIEECPLQNHKHCTKRPSTLKGPSRVIKLCLLGILFPSLLIAIPLYLRYHVYSSQFYPLAMSDMRLLDNKISTTWCQRQLIKANATFNAFLLADNPVIAAQMKTMSMVRQLTLEDDTKEYWGFYLLKGSSVTVSTCVRWPGASLIVIRGHKHLHECAYIGDNSSEEIEELMEAIQEGAYIEPNYNQKLANKTTKPKQVNKPDLMKRHQQDVQFHSIQNSSNKNHTLKPPSSEADSSSDDTDPKALEKILKALQEKTVKQKKKSKIDNKTVDVHLPRNSTIAKGEDGNIKIETPNGQRTQSQEDFDMIVKKFENLGGQKRNFILETLQQRHKNSSNKNDTEEKPELINMKGRHYSKPPVEFDDNIDNARRRKRDIVISGVVDESLFHDDEENNLAIEEGFHPDGIADHRGTINETTLNDYSNSEFWSSFSSSEEALLNCEGLILNLPLTPHHKCSAELNEEQAEEAYLANTITYKVPMNGYYFFVFNSENEIQPNYIRVHFHLKKTLYDVSNPVASCTNSSDVCSMDLKFFSSEKLVMELPVRENDSLWNEEFIVISECEPRSAIYAVCVIAVPIFVMLFAFS